MATILHIESATTNCSVSVAKNGKLLVLKEDNGINYSHAEQLHIFIREALREASLSFSELDAIAVSKGPGSYTGLRIGVSAAKGLCFALDLPLISVPTLQSMALQSPNDTIDFIIPLLDARRMEVYSAVYDAQGVELRETKAEIIEEGIFEAWTSKGKTMLLGNGATKCKEVLSHPNLSFAPDIFPSAREMAPLAFAKFQQNDFEDVAYFEPYYLKDFMVTTKKKPS
jgi:tRNA threonylcarbamoyladenosine biosynthesis protein TsaB